MTVGFPEPVFGHHRLPTGKRLLFAGEATPARCSIATLRHLAPACRRKSQTCLLSCPGDAPSGSRTVVAARVARARGADGPPADRASFSTISTRLKLMPRSNRLDQRGNVETYRNAPSYSPALRSLLAEDSRSMDKSVHGVTFLGWTEQPGPTCPRRATPLLLLQQ